MHDDTAIAATSVSSPAVPSRLATWRVTKRYGPVTALADVSLAFESGTVHALVGENGAGKSTLGRVIAGVTRPDEGSVRIDDKPVVFGSPRAARRSGIARVSQELSLVPQRSVLDNVLIGHLPTRVPGLVSRSAMRDRFEELQAACRIDIDPRRLVATLNLADQARVEILRALAADARVLVLDEPTAAMSRRDTQSVLELVRRLADGGMMVIFVAHSLSDVLATADVVSVLRDGAVVSTLDTTGVDAAQLIRLMIGRDLGSQFPPKRAAPRGATAVLRAEGIRRDPDLGPIDLQLFAGEILGIAGLADNGQTQLLRCLVGAERRDAGAVTVDGVGLPKIGVREAQRAGLVLIPEDRKVKGLHVNLSVRDNICLPHVASLSRFGIMRPAAATRRAAHAVGQFDIRIGSLKSPVSALSGGNQQRVLFAKWMSERPKVLIAVEPTRGIDVAGKRAIYDFLTSSARDGVGVILATSELPEIVGLCDRVLVMRDGRVVAELSGDDVNEQTITELAFGESIGASSGCARP